MTKFVRVLSIVMALALWLASTTHAAYNLKDLRKSPASVGVEFKAIHYSDDEALAMFGARSKRYLDDNWYWGEAGYGAISGSRSGYIEGGLNVGYETQLNTQFFADIALFFGAGGGGRDQDAEGQGFIVYPSLALGTRLNDNLSALLHMGYFSYVNGDLSGTWVGVNLSHKFWGLGGIR
ncbi:MAG: hypothetical protein O3A01_04505 [bacterium]|nr:hypothetical protein [bacterium]